MDRNDLTKIMFLDIETVPAKADFSELSVELAHLWEEKYNLIQKRMPEKYSDETSAAQAFAQSAGIYSEFGKIVCISVGFIHYKGPEMFFRTKSFAGDDEVKLLSDFASLLARFCNIPRTYALRAQYQGI
jgi:hypothetical protein